MPKQPSRSARWMEAVGEARVNLDNLRDCLERLNEIREEYEEWQGNLPENLQSSALGEKLEEVVNLDFDVLSEVETAIDNAEGIDLPQGFGRD